MTASVPLVAPPMPPLTGESTQATPRSDAAFATTPATVGPVVDRSISVLRRFPFRMLPRLTACTIGGVGRLISTMSEDEATSSADDATLAPLAASGFTTSAFVSNTHSVCPASSSRFAIGPPMRPTPTNPNTCSLICPRYSAQLPSYLATQLPLYERIRHRRRGGNPHAFHLQVFLDHVLTALAPDAGALVSAKRREIAHGAIRVDPHRTRLESVGHRQ